MDYLEVKSSQITHIGYGDGVYGPHTLGIKFPPTKTAPASEYHFQNVSQQMHLSLMMAESVGKYFNQHIKAHPDLYPFVKIGEISNPAPPFQSGQVRPAESKENEIPIGYWRVF